MSLADARSGLSTFAALAESALGGGLAGVAGPAEGAAVGECQRITSIASLDDVIGDQATVPALVLCILAATVGPLDDLSGPSLVLRGAVVLLGLLRWRGGQ